MKYMNVDWRGVSASLTCGTGRRHRSHRSLRFAATVVAVLVIGLAGARDAMARLKCQFDSYATLATLPQLKVAQATPINTVLWSASGLTMSAKCGKAAIAGDPEYAWVFRRKLDLGNGLSLFLTYNMDRGNAEKLIQTPVLVKNYYVTGLAGTEVTVQVSLELVKTGTTPTSGGLTGITMDSLVVASIGSASPDQRTDAANFFVYGLRNINFAPSTCTVKTPSVIVNLGQVSLNRTGGLGSAAGSTSAAKDFSVDLLCDAASSGTYGVYMQLSGTTAAGLADRGVLALGAGSSATGLGIQVLRGDTQVRTPVTFNTPWQIGSFPMTSTNLSVPFSARYYQTSSGVTPGTANGVATFTISYQ